MRNLIRFIRNDEQTQANILGLFVLLFGLLVVIAGFLWSYRDFIIQSMTR